MRLVEAFQLPQSIFVKLVNLHRNNRRVWLLFSLICMLCGIASSAAAQTATAVNVPTWRYDNMETGANTHETLLTTANVNTTSFGKLFSIAVDGYVYAQPLYATGLTMSDGLVHNVIFIATQHDTVYASDADTNGGANAHPLWKASLLDTAHGAAAGATTVPNTDVGSKDIVPEIGITATPVYDLASKTLYVVAKSKENGAYVQRLHALNMLTGAEQANSPSQPITATVTGTGHGSSNGQITFSPLWELNRAGLALFNGYLYMAFGAHGDNGPYHGWVMAYNAATLQQTSAVCFSPNGSGNGIWISGAGLPIDTVDPKGRLFVTAGNGSFTNYPPLSAQVDYGNSVVRLDLGNGTLTPGSAFTPFNQATLTPSDTDQGSGGELLLPDQPGPHPHELIQVGKEGRILLLDRDNLGGYAAGGTSNPNAVQEILGATAGLWSTPAYWNGHVYMWGNGDYLKRFDMTNGLLSTTPTSTSTNKSYFPGASPVISSNGTQNGIMWALKTDAYNSNGSAVLFAYDANDVTRPIYESDTNPGRDDAGPATKFTLPVVTNGKVYVGASYQVDVYGLLNGAQQAAAPVISPNGGAFILSPQVTLSTTTPNSSIYYTTDGSLPTATAALYTGPLTITTGTTLRAVTSAQGYLQSAVSSATFTFLTQTPAPTFSPAAGTYTSPQAVTISESAPSSVIYYTVDGSTPTVNSPVYKGPITVSATETVQAIAVGANLTPSVASAATYAIQAGGSSINFGAGFSSVAGLTFNGNSAVGANRRLQITNGSKQQYGSIFYNTPMNIQSFVTDFAFQLSSAQGDGFTFTIQNVAPTALGPGGGGLGYGGDPASTGIANSIAIKFDLYSNAGEGSNSTGLYQNGASPTVPSIDLTSSGVNLHSGDTMLVHATYDSTTLTLKITDTVTGKSFMQSFTINLPQVIGGNTAYIGFTGGSGGYAALQEIISWTYVSLPPSINFGSGFSITTGLTFNGSAVASDDSRLQLTTGGKQQRGSVFYNTPMNIQSFVTDFSFQLSVAQADGFTFTIQNVAPTALGTGGGGLGYGTDNPAANTGINNSIAIKFDLYSNAGEGSDSTGLYQNGASPTIPSIDLTSSGIDLHSGDSMTVHLSYDGTTLAMMLTDTVTGKSFSKNFPINIPQVIGSYAAYVGFTGGTGGYSASQKILTWTFVPNAAASTHAPVITPHGGTFTTPQTVTLTDAESSSTIYYTVDGTVPTTTSPVYSGPFTVNNGTVTVKAFAVALGESPSPASSVTFTIVLPVTAAPTFNLAAGTYIGPQTVTITDATPGATIYYTTDGSTPNTSSNVYTNPLSVVTPETVEAMALAPNHAPSSVNSATYIIQNAGQTIDYGSGFTSASNLALLGSAQLNPAIKALQLTDAHTYEASSAWATTPLNVSAFVSDFTFQMVNPGADGFTFALQGRGTSALGSYGGALGYAGIPDSVALKFDIYDNSGEGKNSIGIYTGGEQPMVPATDLTGSGILLTSGDVFHVHLIYNGTALQVAITDTKTSATYSAAFPIDIPGALGTSLGFVGFTGGTGSMTLTTDILNWTFTPGAQMVAAEPMFSPSPGTYPSAVQVSLSSLTPNATIYYTIDGSQPGNTSAVYQGPIRVSANALTVKAFARALGLQDSPIVTGTYAIQQPNVAPPVFTPAPGTYNSSQTITITTSAPGATILYTTDGTTPTAASTKYTGPITLIATDTLQAVSLIPTVGFSDVTSGDYVIQNGGKVVDFSGGFTNAKGLTLNGISTNPNDGTIAITSSTSKWQTGGIFFNAPVNVSNFQTSFTFQESNAVADGFTFTLQANAPTTKGPGGGGLGYGPDTPGAGGGIPNSVAIKFDIFSNQGEGNNSTGLYTGGASPTIPAIDLTPSGVVLTKGNPILASLTYDGTTLTLTLTDTVTNKSFTHSFTINIPAVVGRTSAYVGFTGGTGGYTANQKILNWTYTQHP